MRNFDWRAVAVILVVMFLGVSAVKLSWGYSDELAKNGIAAKAPMFASKAALSTAMGTELDGWSRVIEKSALLVTSTGAVMIGASIFIGALFLGLSMFRVTTAVSRGIELGAKAQYQERETDAKIRLVVSAPPIQVGPGSRVAQHVLDRGRSVIIQSERDVAPPASKSESVSVNNAPAANKTRNSRGGNSDLPPATSYPVTRVRPKRV